MLLGRMGSINVFLASAVVTAEWSGLRLCSFTPEEKPPLDKKLGGPHSRSGRRGEEKISPLPGPEILPLGRSDRSQSKTFVDEVNRL
jgi:hypothetical protein